MIGLIVKYMDKIYKVGTPGEGVTLSSCIVRIEFLKLEECSMVSWVYFEI